MKKLLLTSLILLTCGVSAIDIEFELAVQTRGDAGHVIQVCGNVLFNGNIIGKYFMVVHEQHNFNGDDTIFTQTDLSIEFYGAGNMFMKSMGYYIATTEPQEGIILGGTGSLQNINGTITIKNVYSQDSITLTLHL